MRRIEDGLARGFDLGQQVQKMVACGPVQVRGRFVQDEDGRVAEQGQPQSQPLLHAAGQSADRLGGLVIQPDLGEDAVRLGRRRAAQPGEEARCLRRRHIGIEGDLLRHIADAAAGGAAIAPCVQPVDADRPRVAQQAEQALDGRGLARAVRPPQGDSLLRGDGQREVVYRGSCGRNAWWRVQTRSWGCSWPHSWPCSWQYPWALGLLACGAPVPAVEAARPGGKDEQRRAD